MAGGYVAFYLELLRAERIQLHAWGVRVPIRTHLCVNIFRKCLNFTEEGTAQVPVQDFTAVMDTDVPLIVESGYICLFPLAKTGIRFVIASFFMLTEGGVAASVTFLFPIMMGLFIECRQKASVALEAKLLATEHETLDMVVNVGPSSCLIRHYHQRHRMTMKDSEARKLSMWAFTNLHAFRFWDRHLVLWLTNVIIGLYLLIGGSMVLHGRMTIGSLLVGLTSTMRWVASTRSSMTWWCEAWRRARP